jgi:hypothetical protein
MVQLLLVARYYSEWAFNLHCILLMQNIDQAPLHNTDFEEAIVLALLQCPSCKRLCARSEGHLLRQRARED